MGSDSDVGSRSVVASKINPVLGTRAVCERGANDLKKRFSTAENIPEKLRAWHSFVDAQTGRLDKSW